MLHRLFARAIATFGLVLMLCAARASLAPTARAAEVQPLQLARVDATTVRVDLGDETGALKFSPSQFEFVAGETYKLVLRNPSPQKHYFTAPDFAAVSWTRKVEAAGVEVKGSVRELELKPGAEAEWVFVPEKSGTYGLRCTISGHAEAGMRGEIDIVLASQSI